MRQPARVLAPAAGPRASSTTSSSHDAERAAADPARGGATCPGRRSGCARWRRTCSRRAADRADVPAHVAADVRAGGGGDHPRERAPEARRSSTRSTPPTPGGRGRRVRAALRPAAGAARGAARGGALAGAARRTWQGCPSAMIEKTGRVVHRPGVADVAAGLTRRRKRMSRLPLGPSTFARDRSPRPCSRRARRRPGPRARARPRRALEGRRRPRVRDARRRRQAREGRLPEGLEDGAALLPQRLPALPQDDPGVEPGLRAPAEGPEGRRGHHGPDRSRRASGPRCRSRSPCCARPAASSCAR